MVGTLSIAVTEVRCQMQDFFDRIGNFRVYNLAETFGVLADTIEVVGAVVMMIGGIWITHLIEMARQIGQPPAAANTGYAAVVERTEAKSIRDYGMSILRQ